MGDRDHGEGIRKRPRPPEGTGHGRVPLTLAPYFETASPFIDFDLTCLPCGVSTHREGLHRAKGALGDLYRQPTFRPDYQQTAPGNQIDQSLKGGHDRIEIGVDVGVVVLDVTEYY